MTDNPSDAVCGGLLELAERVEAATGPDRKIDTAIAFWADREGFLGKHDLDEDGLIVPPAYTASLDAALTLVPEGGDYELTFGNHVPHVAKVWLADRQRGYFFAETDNSRALALCAAALRALGAPIRGGDSG